MLRVALTGAAPGQRWPGWREAASLILTGTRMRLRGLLVDLRGHPRPRARPVAVMLGSAAVLAAFPLLAAGTTTVTRHGGGAELVTNPLASAETSLRDGLVAALAVAVLIILGGLRRSARRRTVVLAVPVAAAGVLAYWLLAGQSPYPALVTAGRWAGLTLLTLAGFAAARVFLHRHERRPDPHID